MATTSTTTIINPTNSKEGAAVKTYGGLSEDAYIEFTPLAFNSFGSFMRLTNKQLSLMIKEHYQTVFHDLCGVYIAYTGNPNSPFTTEFYFSKNSLDIPENEADHKIQNIKDLTITDKNHTNLFYQKRALDMKLAGERFTINDETKVLLSDIMWGGRAANKPNNPKWDNYIQEIKAPVQQQSLFHPTAFNVMVKVSGCFDLHKILQKILPKTMVTSTTVDENGKITNYLATSLYEVRFIRFTRNDPFMFIMNIEQFDKKEVEKMALNENPAQRAINGIIYY